MLRVPSPKYRGDGSGVVWPDTGISAPSEVRDPFGPRPFSAHVATVGYDYDFHRGIDVPGDVGAPVYSPINGSVIRLHRTHFGWETDGQLTHWGETDPSAAIVVSRQAPSALRLACSRVGALSFPATVGRYRPVRERLTVTEDDWVLELVLSSAISLAGGVIGFGVHDPINDEWLLLEYDGATLTIRGEGSGGAITEDGTTAAAASQIYLRIAYDKATDTFTWRYSVDGDSWTDVASEAGIGFTTATVPQWEPIIFWRATDGAGGAPQNVDVDFFGWADTGQSIQRFGNWLEVADATQRFVLIHFRELDVELGDVVRAGQLLGTMGLTGFDARSGRILYSHTHLERIADNEYIYSNDSPINPLPFLPHTDTTANVSAAVTEEDDPDAVASFKLRVTVARADEDFDLNQISLTGDSATRTVNFDTRAGLNADNDVPKQDGVYLVPAAFDEESASYIIDAYFNKSTVGTTLVSYEVRQSSGAVVASG